MLFVYATPVGRHAFWMKDMHFDIDIVWIAGGRVAEIHHDVAHEPWERVVRPEHPVDLVLEVTAGTARRLGWQAGDPVDVEPDPRDGLRTRGGGP